MKHIHFVSRATKPAKASNLLEAAAFLLNFLNTIVALQELQDLLTKSDTHDNT